MAAALIVWMMLIGKKPGNQERYSSVPRELRDAAYHFQGDADNDQLSVTPLVGLGKSSLLNKTIFHLMPCAEQKLTICTPYFNLPAILVRNIIQLLREGKKGRNYCW